ncbi:MAG: transketolase C-terminal domain-containing protein [Clostridia bacterium]|nr:transketolase C-terminal domain-containing protein [Clostridia bacterium]
MIRVPFDEVSMSVAYANVHQRMIDDKKNTMVITADFTYGMGLTEFARKNPDRFVNMGIAEQNMAGFAAGLSEEGFVPFIHCFGVFASRRMLDQVYISCAYAGLNVKVVGADPGYTSGHNGGTHMSMEDIAIYRAIPQAVIVEPTDAAMLGAIIPMLADYKGLCYIRFFRGIARRVYDDGATFEIGKAQKLRDGNDVSLIACGRCVADALEAADILSGYGIEARVMDMFTIKPLDVEAVVRACKETRLIITVENAIAAGGLGGAVCEALSGFERAPVVRMGRADVFGEVATADELKKHYHLTSDDIASVAVSELNKLGGIKP